MKALTGKQPLPSLAGAGVVSVWTVARPTDHRGHVALHAARTWTPVCPDGGTCWHGCRAKCYRTVCCAPLAGAPVTPTRCRGPGGLPVCCAPLSGVLPGDEWPPFPLGVVVGSAVITDCVPIVNEADPTPDGPFVYADLGNFTQVHDGPDDSTPRYSEDEVHFGDFSPGRWALLLTDAKPTTERCPYCWGRHEVPCLAHTTHDPGCFACQHSDCPACEGEGVCEPVPARGHPGLWEWEGVKP